MKENLDSEIRKHEMSFVESYKNHMRKISRDMDKYKKAINEKEFTHRRDDRIV